ncbi:hypothetical protein [Tessaracoccus sp.]
MAVPDQSSNSGERDRSAMGMDPSFDSRDSDRAAPMGAGNFDGEPELDPGFLGFDDRDDPHAGDAPFPTSIPEDAWSRATTPTDTDATSGAADRVKHAAVAAGDRVADVAGTAQEEAAAVKDTAVGAGSDLADSMAEQAGDVAQEVGHQSRRLMDEGMSELRSQAGVGQQRLAELSRSFGGELQAMHSNSDQSGPLTDLVGSAQQVFDDAANWLERNEPADVLDSVRRYAARNPWTFLAISAGVGFLGARVVRGLTKPEGAEQPRSALEVPARYHGGYAAPIAPVEDPTYAGGPRYGTDTRVQPSSTPATAFPPPGDPGWGGTPGMPPIADVGGGSRGL